MSILNTSAIIPFCHFFRDNGDHLGILNNHHDMETLFWLFESEFLSYLCIIDIRKQKCLFSCDKWGNFCAIRQSTYLMLCNKSVLSQRHNLIFAILNLGIFQLSRPMPSLTVVGNSLFLHTNRIPEKK